jgi:hypothetical protein
MKYKLEFYFASIIFSIILELFDGNYTHCDDKIYIVNPL